MASWDSVVNITVAHIIGTTLVAIPAEINSCLHAICLSLNLYTLYA